MKIFALAAVALTAFTPAAFAMNSGLSAGDAYEIRIMVPSADLSNLTDAQVLLLADAIHHGQGSDAGQKIRSILK